MTQTKVKVKCAKCDGKGSIEGFGHIANGVCFWCKGSGVLTSVSEDYRKHLKYNLLHTAGIVLDAAEYDDTERAEFYANLMIDDLFLVGTEAAREILDFIGKGEYHREYGERCVCPPEKAAIYRKFIIEQGRARLG